jgi:AhpD family alkylhydroperoxidase
MSIKYLKSPAHVGAESFSGKILTQIRREFGAEVEPFTLHLPVPELLAGAWMVCRETLLAGKGAREAKEIVAAAISTLNRCPYCVDAHSMMLLGASGEDYETLQTSERSPYAEWAMATLTPSASILTNPPFSSDEAPAFIGTAIFFHYINRMVTILLGASPLPFTTGLPKRVSMQMAAWFFRKAILLPKQPGRSLNLLPPTSLPEDFSWAKASLEVSQAYACFAKAIEDCGAISLSQEVRTRVSNAVQQWNGEDHGIESGWLDEAIANLGEGEQDAGRLALLTALAPWRVDEKIVQNFSFHLPGDERLVAALAWSSFTAARKIGSWLTIPILES